MKHEPTLQSEPDLARMEVDINLAVKHGYLDEDILTAENYTNDIIGHKIRQPVAVLKTVPMTMFAYPLKLNNPESLLNTCIESSKNLKIMIGALARFLGYKLYKNKIAFDEDVLSQKVNYLIDSLEVIITRFENNEDELLFEDIKRIFDDEILKVCDDVEEFIYFVETALGAVKNKS